MQKFENKHKISIEFEFKNNRRIRARNMFLSQLYTKFLTGDIFLQSQYNTCINATVLQRGKNRYHQQQNKWYPLSCLLAYFEATLYFSPSEFTCS